MCRSEGCEISKICAIRGEVRFVPSSHWDILHCAVFFLICVVFLLLQCQKRHAYQRDVAKALTSEKHKRKRKREPSASEADDSNMAALLFAPTTTTAADQAP